MDQQPPHDNRLVPMSLQSPAQQAPLAGTLGVSDWAALQAYQAFLASAGIPFPLTVAPTGVILSQGVPAYQAQLLSQQYVPQPPPIARPVQYPVIDVAHTTVTDSSRQCLCDACQRREQQHQSMGAQHAVSTRLQHEQASTQLPSHRSSLQDTHTRPHSRAVSQQGFQTKKPARAGAGAGAGSAGGVADATNSYACSFCSRKFSFRKDHEIHMLTHTSERPYACELCPWSFTDKWKLAAHQRTHDGLRPYTCPRCNESFSQKPTLTRHLRTHTGERPYLCRHCPATFLDSKNLSRHMRVHVGKRGPYSCSECNASFNRKQMLTAHRRVHNGSVSGGLAASATKAA